MSTSTTASDQPPKGYVSEVAKRRYTITAGILGAAFFALQFIVPMVLMFAMMPLMFARMAFTFTQADRAVFWNGHVWTVQTSARAGFPPEESTRLVYLDPSGEEEQVEAADLPGGRPWLLPDRNRLWLIWPDRVACHTNGQLHWLEPDHQLEGYSRPFVHADGPAVAEYGDGQVVIRALIDGQWTQHTTFTLELPGNAAPEPGDLVVITAGRTLHLFAKLNRTLQHCRVPLDTEEPPGRWKVVRRGVTQWAASLVGGTPVVLCGPVKNGVREVVGFRLSDGRWQRFFSHRAGMANTISICPTTGNAFLLVSGTPPFGVRMCEVTDGRVTSETRHGTGFPFPFGKGTMALMMVPHCSMLAAPLVLALVLSSLMAKYRITRHAGETGAAPYAPLWRRALAQLIDALILAGPFALSFVAMFSIFSDFEKMMLDFDEGPPLGFFVPHLFMCLGIPWAIAWLFVFSALEGRWGVTPGKWVLGIRVVGTDLRPCGFGRALVRNLLKVVDGFFNFLVGVMLVALTENWQRVGDLAARTVVVMAPRRETGLFEEPPRPDLPS